MSRKGDMLSESTRRELVENTFKRWGSDKRPEMSDEAIGQMMAITLGLGALFGENIETEREWMNTPNRKFKTRPITMVLAGSLKEVMQEVDRMRSPW
jgi:hypothetical protein